MNLLVWAFCIVFIKADILPKNQRDGVIGSFPLRQLHVGLTRALIASSAATSVGAVSQITDRSLTPDVFLDNNAFRERYPYAKPSDFIDYLNDVTESGNFNSVLGAAYKFAGVYKMYVL